MCEVGRLVGAKGLTKKIVMGIDLGFHVACVHLDGREFSSGSLERSPLITGLLWKQRSRRHEFSLTESDIAVAGHTTGLYKHSSYHLESDGSTIRRRRRRRRNEIDTASSRV